MRYCQNLLLYPDKKVGVFVASFRHCFRLFRALFFFLILISSDAFSQIFRHFSEQDGAPLTTVMEITQDKEGFMWFATTTGLFRYDSHTFKKYSRDDEDPDSVSGDYVNAVYCDSDGNVWIGTDRGVSLYDRQRDVFINFSHSPDDVNSLSANNIFCFYGDAAGRLWVGNTGGLDKIEREGSHFRVSRFPLSQMAGEPIKQVRAITGNSEGGLWLGAGGRLIWLGEGLKEMEQFRRDSGMETLPRKSEFISMYEDDSGRLWLGENNGGLLSFDRVSGTFSQMSLFRNSGMHLPVVSGIIPDKNGKLWIATWSGLALFDPTDYQVKWYLNKPEDPGSLVDESIFSICLDHQGGLWIGTYYLGISYMHSQTSLFSLLEPRIGDSRYKEFRNAFVGMTRRGQIWSVSEDASQMVYRDSDGRITASYTLSLSPSLNYRFFYVGVAGILWYARDAILCSYDPRTGKRGEYPLMPEGQVNEVIGYIIGVFEDSRGRFWVYGDFGVVEFDRKTKRFGPVKTDRYVATAFEDASQTLWFGGGEEAFFLLSGEDIFRKVTLPSMEKTTQWYIWRIVEDAAGRIWFASNSGIWFYDKRTGVPAFYSRGREGITDGALDLQADNLGYLWIAEGHKLVRHHPDKGTTQTYGYGDGVPPGSAMRVSASFKGEKDFVYFVTNKGVFRFNPGQIPVDSIASTVAFTSLKLFNNKVLASDATGLLPEGIGGMDRLTFRHDQNIFTIDFALLSYLRRDRNEYAYKLEGFEDEWNHVTIPSATYMNLPPGSYTFLIKAANGDGYWSKEPLALTIVVLVPWWKTWYAYLFAVIILGAAIYGVVRFFWLRGVYQKESQLYHSKLEFFTGLSHEIRTSVSLIAAPLQQAVTSGNASRQVQSYLLRAKDNTDKLSELINELLDFRKLESDNMELSFQELDIVKFIKGIVAVFELAAEEKAVTTVTSLPSEPVMVWFDKLRLQKVFYNLMSNAYKFSHMGGEVKVILKDYSREVVIQIEDNGKGIAPESLKDVFTSFFQVPDNARTNPGYGIGLALCKSILAQHQGEISVHSRPAGQDQDGWTCFTVKLKKGNAHFDSYDQKSPPLVDQNEVAAGTTDTSEDHRYSLLLIEDNEELRSATRETFQDRYRILEAADGVEGIAMATQHLPDLILSDIMMPELNGIEVCKRLKVNIATSHIPIVLLTARSAGQQVLEGLQAGADDYLIKPFDFRVLEVKLDNLIRNRERLRLKYSRSALLEPETEPGNDREQEFVHELRKLILDNISFPDFGVNEMAFQMGVSVSVLYRKLRMLTGMTVNEFMKTLRMKEAKQLLESGTYNVNEVATMVGFESSRYFSREFKKTYDLSPNEVRKKKNRQQ